jgi:two-component system response regulator HydG
MQRIFRLISKVSQNRYPVLVLGESGTGKEVVARAIHYNGPDRERPFIPVDCGALVPSLIESELFGYVKGAFTGANQNHEGLLEVGNGGTVFLDEIAELPVDLQAKLLRAIQEKEIRPVGSSRRVRIDVRIIAATNRDLETAVAEGSFRKDLFFRLNVVSIKLPPLRERAVDIPLLVDHFLEKYNRPGQTAKSFSDDAMSMLMNYDWPGNVRELENSIERAVALSSGPVMTVNDLPSSMRQPNAAAPAGPVATIRPIADLERDAIMNALTQLHGDKLLAAKLLGIGKTTLYRKLKEYALEPAAETGSNGHHSQATASAVTSEK